MSLFQQILVQEELGKATGALWDVPWRPAIPLKHATEAQKTSTCGPRARASGATATRSPRKGPGPTRRWSRPPPSAPPAGAGSLRGEKWHVTSGDIADFVLLHAHVDGDRPRRPCSSWTRICPASGPCAPRKYMHTFVFEHPIVAFDDVRVGDDKVLGESGRATS